MKKCIAAICDDEEMSLDMVSSSLESCFRQNGVQLTLDRYTSSSELFEAARRGTGYQVVFLDIDMPEMDGIDLGVRLKELMESAAIIYISNCEERVFESFKARPFGFVRKSSFLKDIQSVVKLYVDSRKGVDTRRLEVKSSTGLTQVPLSDIIYIECNKDYQFFHLKNGEQPLKCRISMTNLERSLGNEGFLRTHQGYIVNYSYIKRIGSESLELTTGVSVPMSRRKKQEVLTQYMRLSRNDKLIITT